LNRKGSAAGFVALVVFVLGFFLFVLASPILFEFVVLGAESTGSAAGFFIYLFPFVILLFIVLKGLGAFSGAGGSA